MYREDEDGEHFGIDWAAMANRQVMRRVHDAEDADAPYQVQPPINEIEQPDGAPPNLAHVPCEPMDCPLDPDDLDILKNRIAAEYPVYSDSLLHLRQKWVSGLECCRALSDDF